MERNGAVGGVGGVGGGLEGGGKEAPPTTHRAASFNLRSNLASLLPSANGQRPRSCNLNI